MRRVSRSRVRRSLTVSVSSVLIVRRHRRVGRDLGARDCFLVPRLLVARLFSREESLSPAATAAAPSGAVTTMANTPTANITSARSAAIDPTPCAFTAASRGSPASAAWTVAFGVHATAAKIRSRTPRSPPSRRERRPASRHQPDRQHDHA